MRTRTVILNNIRQNAASSYRLIPELRQVSATIEFRSNKCTIAIENFQAFDATKCDNAQTLEFDRTITVNRKIRQLGDP